MRDRQVQYPNRFRLNAVSGQENVYDLVAVPGTVTQAGTALNKANLLSDATAALLGLTGDPTVNQALALIGDKLKAETGSYVGTGTYGSANPNTLTFSFAPKLVIIQPSSGSAYGPMFVRNGVTATAVNYHDTSQTSTVTWSNGGKTLSWYTQSNMVAFQLNTNNYVYIYIAIG